MKVVANEYDSVRKNSTEDCEQDSEHENGISLTIDEAIETAKFGCFQYRLVFMCGLVFMADAMEVMLLSFMQVLVRKDWNLSPAEEASIAGAVFVGELPGALFWGIVGDRWGRRSAYLFSAIFVAFFGIASAFSNNLITLVILRSLVGFGVSGSIIPFDIMLEFSPSKYRGKALMLTQVFWTFGTLFVAFLAWIVAEPLGWRWLTGLCSIPLVLAIFCFHYLPESPRWLSDRGDNDEAICVLQSVAKTNRSNFPENATLVVKHVHESSQTSVKELFSPYLRRTTLLTLIIWQGFGFSYYGIVLFFPRMFKAPPGQVFNYKSILISTASEIIGVIVTTLIIDPVGRRKTQGIMYFCCSIFLLLLSFRFSTSISMILAIVARAAIMGSSSATWVATPESFPTHVRASGHGLASSAARISGFFTPFIADSESISLATTCYIYTFVVLITSAAAFSLPKVSFETVESIQDINVDRVKSNELSISKATELVNCI